MRGLLGCRNVVKAKKKKNDGDETTENYITFNSEKLFCDSQGEGIK